jgi:hypothetical protein
MAVLSPIQSSVRSPAGAILTGFGSNCPGHPALTVEDKGEKAGAPINWNPREKNQRRSSKQQNHQVIIAELRHSKQ